MRKIVTKLSTVILSLAIVFSIFATSGIQVNADGNRASEFIERLYVLILGRESDPDGLAYWNSEFDNGRTAASVVDFFFGSNEMAEKNLNDEEFVDIAYRAILGREAEEDGKQGWLDVLNNGGTRHDVLAGFIEAPEFSALCEEYGVTKGSLIPEPVIPPKDKFIAALYLNVLGRAAVQSEIDSWVSVLDQGKTAAYIVQRFFESSEFEANMLTNEEYVAVCYRALLGREGIESEIAYWANIIATAKTRTQVLAYFAESAEFTALCAEMGVERGFISTAFVSRLDQATLTAQQRFVTRCYNAFYDRDPVQSELDFWGNKLKNGTTAAVFLQTLTNSGSYTSRRTSNSDYVEDIHLATLGRIPSDSARATWTSRLNTSVARYGLINFLVSSTEFKNICRTFSVTPGNVDLTGTGTWVIRDGVRALRDSKTGFYASCGWCWVDGYRFYFNDDGHLRQDVDSLLGKQSEYYLTVDTTVNVVMVYCRTYAGGKFDTPVKIMICSTGLPETPTVKGTFTLRPIGRWHVLNGGVWGQYCTQISGNFLFHSVWYYEQGNIKSITVGGFEALGNNASHGCVRLTVSDAKWIYNNCGGCRVNIAFNQAQPFTKPVPYAPVRVSGDWGYDPRDPAL